MPVSTDELRQRKKWVPGTRVCHSGQADYISLCVSFPPEVADIGKQFARTSLALLKRDQCEPEQQNRTGRKTHNYSGIMIIISKSERSRIKVA